jgi:hypothetical protein
MLWNWITPKDSPKKLQKLFDTKFYVTEFQENQIPCHDGSETISTEWFDIDAAITSFEEEKIQLLSPTWFVLKNIQKFNSIESFMLDLKNKTPERFQTTLLKQNNEWIESFPGDELHSKDDIGFISNSKGIRRIVCNEKFTKYKFKSNL